MLILTSLAPLGNFFALPTEVVMNKVAQFSTLWLWHSELFLVSKNIYIKYIFYFQKSAKNDKKTKKKISPNEALFYVKNNWECDSPNKSGYCVNIFIHLQCAHVKLTGRPWVYQMKTTALKRSKYFNFLTKYTGKAKYTRVSSKLRYLILCTLCSPQMDKYGRKLIIPLPCFKSWQKVEENVLTQRGPSNLWRIDGGEGVINMDITYSGALG